MENKNFTEWNRQKMALDSGSDRTLFREQEIWFCHFGLNIGSEQNGVGRRFLRPVIVLKKFSHQVFWGIPLTKAIEKVHANTEYYYMFSYKTGVQSAALLTQIRLLDAKRLAYKSGFLSESSFLEIQKKLKFLLT